MIAFISIFSLIINKILILGTVVGICIAEYFYFIKQYNKTYIIYLKLHTFVIKPSFKILRKYIKRVCCLKIFCINFLFIIFSNC